LGASFPSADNNHQIAATPEYEIDYCLSSATNIGGKCQLQYSLIMTCVIIANTVKLICIMCFLCTQSEPVLATIGDEIASFLEQPDLFTAEQPFLSRDNANSDLQLLGRLAATRQPARWQKTKRALRWWQAPSQLWWVITLTS
jgi:hypothetical protein